LISWNVNGLRAVIRKGTFASFVQEHQPDILCLQETKAKQGQAEIDLPEYEEFWNSAQKPGYAGTAIFSKIKPRSVSYDIPGVTDGRFKDVFGNALTEGRIMTAEFDEFHLVNVYTPNAKRDLARLRFRHDVWDPEFLRYIKHLEKTKPVVLCGDLTYHEPGQLVGYIILDLKTEKLSVKAYLDKVENLIINTLARIDIEAGKHPDLVGVWVGDKKIASIGIGIKKGITMHGFALNINNNMDGFSCINPCGLSSNIMTSVKALKGEEISFELIQDLMIEEFYKIF